MARSKKNTVTLDLSSADSRLNLYGFSGQYAFEVNTAVYGKNKNTDNEQIQLKATIVDSPYPKFVGKTLNIIFGLQTTQLWVLRNFLEAVDIDIPSGPFELDLDDLVSRRFCATVEDNSYDNKNTHKIREFTFYQGEDQFEEEEVEVKSTKKTSKDEVEEVKPKEEVARNKQVTYTSDDIADMAEDELEDLVEKFELQVDLSEYATLRKKINVVVKSMTDLGLISEDE